MGLKEGCELFFVLQTLDGTLKVTLLLIKASIFNATYVAEFSVQGERVCVAVPSISEPVEHQYHLGKCATSGSNST